MLQVWKITIPSDYETRSASHGWALAQTAEEAKILSGYETAIIEQKPEHLWIARERVIWERRNSA